MSLAIVDDVAAFLATVPPFQLLDAEELHRIASCVQVDFYPEGTVILAQKDPPSAFLQVIVRGGVKVFIAGPGERELGLEYRAEGDLLGFLSLTVRDRARTTVVAVEDTTCYLIPRRVFLRLMDSNPLVRSHFHRAFLTKYMDKLLGDARERSLLEAGPERPLYTTTAGEALRRAAVTACGEVSVREAAAIMSHHRISSLVLTGRDGGPAGILTDRDLRELVAARSDTSAPARGAMHGELVTAEAGEPCFEALLTMIRRGIHHLPVVEGGALRGVITDHDLLLLQDASPVAVAREIEAQETIAGLAALAGRINGIVRLFLAEGARAGAIARIITEVNDRLVKKALEIVERDLGLGPAPLPWCWIVLGSEGRREQTFKTDQDNALVYADPPDPARAAEAARWFEAFAGAARDALVRCGFPVCPAGYMASDARWRLPLQGWKRLFSEWIAAPTAEAVLASLALLDFRPLHGEAALAAELREHVVAAVGRAPAFLGFVANQLVKNPPPIGLLKRFVVERSGAHRDELDLKLKGIAPIVDLVRLYSLERGVRATSTLERIEALRTQHTIVEEHAEELVQAFEFILLLRIQHQHGRIARGEAPDNFVNPGRLSNLERKSLKEAFALIARLQDLVIERYRASIL